ncbi:hypothetical protein PV10_09183 [Exophiala mesophila]|uniref:BZIP domain-containing protein n=1 Tax=Exophiala mesophila TaxID=212818 RepID=A0A0D1WGX5_EXOME|nr:uncharacterized protein PV10_09183 [Exophiala mesophila]KIV88005.1 hypothetical protein PV10_09183 [Exophiala mesophila]
MIGSNTEAGKRKRGRPQLDAKQDKWYGVEDLRERKRIQDRLAQRARRKRIHPDQPASEMSPRKGSDSIKSTPAKDAEAHDDAEDVFASEDRLPDESHTLHELLSFTDQSRLTISGSWDSAKVMPWPVSRPPSQLFTTSIGSDHWYLCWPAWSIYAALSSHGMIMRTSCLDCTYDGVSSIDDGNIPGALKPSPLQLLTKHRRWIDRFPFPRMRDNMILLSEVIDLDQFCADLFGSASFTLKDSHPTWEATSWIVGREFAQKWGYLLL